MMSVATYLQCGNLNITISNNPSVVSEIATLPVSHLLAKTRKGVAAISYNPLIFMAHPRGLEPGQY